MICLYYGSYINLKKINKNNYTNIIPDFFQKIGKNILYITYIYNMIKNIQELWKFIILPGIIMLALDGVFLYTNKNTFITQIMDVQGTTLQFKIVGAIICYICLIYGLYYFILREHRPVIDSILLGLVIYGVYESTTYALFTKWKFETMLLDISWGGILFGLTTYVTYTFT